MKKKSNVGGCFVLTFIVLAAISTAIWYGVTFNTIWTSIAIGIVPIWIAIWLTVYIDDYREIDKKAESQNWDALKIKKEKASDIRFAIMFTFIGLMFAGGVAAGIHFQSFWIGAAAWLVPSLIAFLYTAFKS